MWMPQRLDALTVWFNKEVKERLKWYYEVMAEKKPAKYLICKRVPTELKLEEASEKELWSEHKRLSEEFKKIWNKIKKGELKLNELKRAKTNFLSLKIEIVERILENCHFCERKCRINRRKEVGYCKLKDKSYVASFFLHYGEEAPLVPSGTIFFLGCNFSCVFCQNWDISQEWRRNNRVNGVKADPEVLARIIKELKSKRARNINFVGGSPTPNLHTILNSLKYISVNVPLLWNSNFYMSMETNKILTEVIDICLPDLKYFNDECALRLSKVPKYFEKVSRNIKYFHDEEVDTIIRHLVLPNHLNCCSKPLLEWISENCPHALVNCMSQYRPEFLCKRHPAQYPDINRRPSQEEMKEIHSYCDKLGLVWRPIS